MHSTPKGAAFVPVRGLVVLTDGSLRWPDASAARSNPNETLIRFMNSVPDPIRRLIEALQQLSILGWFALLGAAWGGVGCTIK
jgi:hypothetical protein